MFAVSRLLVLTLFASFLAAPVASLDAQERPRSSTRIAPRISIIGPQTGGRLGVMLDVQESPSVAGVRVIEVIEGSPAESAGLAAYDILTHLDGTSLAAALSDAEAEAALDDDRPLPPQRLIALLSDRDPGDTVRLRYRRDGAEGEVSVALGEPEAGLVRFGDGRTLMLRGGAPSVIQDGVVLRLDSLGTNLRGLRSDRAPLIELELDSLRSNLENLRVEIAPDIRLRLDSLGRRGTVRSFEVAPGALGRTLSIRTLGTQGLELRDLDGDLAAYFGGPGGALVLSAAEDNPLQLRGGDVILAIDGREVEDTDDAQRILGSYESGDDVTLRIRRDGAEREVTGTIG